jgi:hypothetical protein
MERNLKIMNQLCGYAESGFLDFLYLCSPDDMEIRMFKTWMERPEFLLREFGSQLLELNLQSGIRYRSEHGALLRSLHLLKKCGLILAPFDEEVRKIKEASQLNRMYEPNISIGDEEKLRHALFVFYFRHLPICDEELPNPGGKEPVQRVDLLIFRGSSNIAEIFNNQDKMDLIGIEVKTSIRDKKHIVRQLRNYLDSSSLTRLYLAVPEKFARKAKDLLSEELPKVGVLSLTEVGDVQIMKEASKLEMKYDSILIRIKGFRGYESERIKKIGWG